MTEQLFKLKKDGKAVGYLKFEKVGSSIASIAIYLTQENLEMWYPLWKMHYEGSSHSYEYIVGNKNVYIIFDEICPFVTKDKNGKDVFANDKVKARNGFECIIKYYPTQLRWGLHNPKPTNKEGLCVTWTDSWDNEELKDIELIEDKDNE